MFPFLRGKMIPAVLCAAVLLHLSGCVPFSFFSRQTSRENAHTLSAEEREREMEAYWDEVRRLVERFYPGGEVKVSTHYRDNGGDSTDYQHWEKGYFQTSDGTAFLVSVCYVDTDRLCYGHFCVDVERNIASMSLCGFREKELEMFCALTGIASEAALSLETCGDIIHDSEHYNADSGGDYIMPVERYLLDKQGHYVFYDVIDLMAQGLETEAYHERLRCEVMLP